MRRRGKMEGTRNTYTDQNYERGGYTRQPDNPTYPVYYRVKSSGCRIFLLSQFRKDERLSLSTDVIFGYVLSIGSFASQTCFPRERR
jgi:hypothetical protein